jgi:hypothetical protein
MLEGPSGQGRGRPEGRQSTREKAGAMKTRMRDTWRGEAEQLYEELGGDLCICQRTDVRHWCEKCQQRIALIASALKEAFMCGYECSASDDDQG